MPGEHDELHRLLYASDVHSRVTWRGVPMVKNPLDLVAFAEIIERVRPRVIVETGTRAGGSALWFADVMTAVGIPNPKVVTVDVMAPKNPVKDPRIVRLLGDSTSPDVLDLVHIEAHEDAIRMVVLDSDHSAVHVQRELGAYAYLVSPGSYLIVEDTNIGGNPIESEALLPGDGGPGAAVEKWLPEHPEFTRDRQIEPVATYNPGGWLRRVR